MDSTTVFLASVFGVDCLTYTVLSNHFHLILRSRPDVVKAWSDQEVARRWLRLFPTRREKDGSPVEPEDFEISMITSDRKKLAEIRKRLSDASWWMRCTAENIARRSNKEGQCTGRFWEGRYKAQVILDDASLLACAAYVDLNPVRAAMARTPEESEFTGAKDRIDDLTGRESKSSDTHAWERSRRRAKSGWLSPLETNERTDPVGADISPVVRRASSLQATDFANLANAHLGGILSGQSDPNMLFVRESKVNIADGGWIRGRPMIARFSTPALRVGTFFETSLNATITMTAFSGTGDLLETLIVSGTEDSRARLLTGFIGIENTQGIGHVVLSSDYIDATSLNFGIDDFRFEPIPEPDSRWLFLIGLTGVWNVQRRLRIR